VGYAKKFKREQIPVSNLTIGLKCGGSDGFSGITANPLAGRVSDKITGFGGITILSEVPEMFGAETILMNRCKTEGLFRDTVGLINDYKAYYAKYGQEI
jgi:altronate hydrolase